ncbi:MAG: hypothetical protein U0105_26050 [Candidatus Obscuribacterales bacterium]
MRIERYADGEAAYTKAITITPKDADLYYWCRGDAYIDARTREGAADLNKSIRLDPSVDGGYVSRADVYNTMAQYQSAPRRLRQGRGARGRQLGDVLQSGTALEQGLDRAKSGVEEYTKSLAAKEVPMTYEYRGRAYDKLGDKAAAAADHAQAKRLGWKK